MKTAIIVLVSCVFFYFLVIRLLFPLIMSFMGKIYLRKKLFHSGNMQKTEILEKFHEITENKYNDKQAIDYFMKEKGLQFLLVTPNAPLILKYYLSNSTKVNLTFFEKVKFHEFVIKYKH